MSNIIMSPFDDGPREHNKESKILVFSDIAQNNLQKFAYRHKKRFASFIKNII